MTERKLRIGPWGRAAGVALVVAAWLACSNRLSPPGGTPTDTVDWNVPSATREMANLNFALKDVAGTEFRLADLKGHPVLLNFWATWCVPCKTEMPMFVEFAEMYKAKNFKVVGISVDDTADDIRKFTAEHPVSYPLLLGRDQTDLLKAYHAGDFIPVSWLIRPDGVVRIKIKGIHEKAWFQQQIEALF
jgi:thiol-disulfide isomerase/thioredoxin